MLVHEGPRSLYDSVQHPAFPCSVLQARHCICLDVSSCWVIVVFQVRRKSIGRARRAYAACGPCRCDVLLTVDELNEASVQDFF